MPRQSLSDLLGNVDDPTPTETAPAPKVADPATEEAPRSVKEPTGDEPSAAPVAARPVRPEKGQAELPSYLRLVRKETRLREDQQNQLTFHARRLNRAKAAGTARITDNTLIRVAVDLLLARIDTAVGDDEAALLKSLNR